MNRLTTLLAILFAGAILVAGSPPLRAQSDTAVQADAVVHAIDGAKVNLTHDPIPAIGWPKMTMDLSLLEGADASGIQAGDAVTIELRRGPSGLFGISRITPKRE